MKDSITLMEAFGFRVAEERRKNDSTGNKKFSVRDWRKDRHR